MSTPEELRETAAQAQRAEGANRVRRPAASLPQQSAAAYSQQPKSAQAEQPEATQAHQPEAAQAQQQEGSPKPRPRRSSRNRRTMMKWRQWGVRAVMVVMVVGCVLGFAFFLRPGVSELENRTLTSFPEFTVESFLDGSYTAEVSLWYADTFPLREQLVQANLNLKSLYGVRGQTQLIGGNRTSDELPPEGERTEPTVKHERPQNVSAPEARAMAAEMEGQVTDGMYVDVSAGAVYTLFYFDQDATQAYVDVINDAADLLDGKATVYSVLLPTNGGIMLSDETLSQLGVPDQKQVIDYYYSLMDENVTIVPTFDILKEHDDEYLYFRTDHHWQQLAAYYVYTSLCDVKGIEPAPYDQWEELEFPNYYGEYQAAQDNGFPADTLYARVPQGTNEMEYWEFDMVDSSYATGPVVADLSGPDSDPNKYNCFVCGNRPLSHIHNPNVTDGSSCLVVKDSFGNAFTSVLVDSYEDIYTFDFRFTNQSLVSFVEEHGIQDVIFENVIMFAGTYNCSDLLATIVYPDKRIDVGGSSTDEGDESGASSEGQGEGEGQNQGESGNGEGEGAENAASDAGESLAPPEDSSQEGE